MTKKLYFKIGEACKKLDIQPYVLRYWETEFPVLDPDKSKSGQRVYTEDDLEVIRRIKELLYDEGYTIAGAKKKLEAEIEDGVPAPAPQPQPAAATPPTPTPVALGTAPALATAPTLDTAPGERVERLRHGVRQLLDEAREVLDLLGGRKA